MHWSKYQSGKLFLDMAVKKSETKTSKAKKEIGKTTSKAKSTSKTDKDSMPKAKTATKEKSTKKKTKVAKETVDIANRSNAAINKAAKEELSEYKKLQAEPDVKFDFKEFVAKRKGDLSIEDKLRALYHLQLIDSKIDRIRHIRGELPMEVADLEDEIAGLETRINKIKEEHHSVETEISNKKQLMKDAKAQIKKYEEQQGNVKNNREYESLGKEIEFQQLEIQLAEKRIKEYTESLNNHAMLLESASQNLVDRNEDLLKKKQELESIVSETKKEEEELLKSSTDAETIFDNRLITAYQRIRKTVRNGLAVVTVQRNSCGGCFNKIPAQRQLDIRQHKKLIVCEHCGRILVDETITEA